MNGTAARRMRERATQNPEPESEKKKKGSGAAAAAGIIGVIGLAALGYYAYTEYQKGQTSIAISTSTPTPAPGDTWAVQGAIVDKGKALANAKVDLVVTNVIGGGTGGGGTHTCAELGPNAFCSTARGCQQAGGTSVRASDCLCCVVTRALQATPPGTVIGSATSGADGLFEISGTVPADWNNATVGVMASYIADPALGTKDAQSNAIAFAVATAGGGGGPTIVHLTGIAGEFQGPTLGGTEITLFDPHTGQAYKTTSAADGSWGIDVASSKDYEITALRSGYLPFKVFIHNIFSNIFLGDLPTMTPITTLPPYDTWQVVGDKLGMSGNFSTYPIAREVTSFVVTAKGAGRACQWGKIQLNCICQAIFKLYLVNPQTLEQKIVGTYHSQSFGDIEGYLPDPARGWVVLLPPGTMATNWALEAVNEMPGNQSDCQIKDCKGHYPGPFFQDPAVRVNYSTTLVTERAPSQNPANPFFADLGNGGAAQFDPASHSFSPAAFPVGTYSAFGGGQVDGEDFGGYGAPIPLIFDIQLDDLAEAYGMSKAEITVRLGDAKVIAHPVVGPGYAVWRAVFDGVSPGSHEVIISLDGETDESPPRVVHCDTVYRVPARRDLRNIPIQLTRDSCRYAGPGPMPKQNCACSRGNPPTGPRESATPDVEGVLALMREKGVPPTAENFKQWWRLVNNSPAPSSVLARLSRREAM